MKTHIYDVTAKAIYKRYGIAVEGADDAVAIQHTFKIAYRYYWSSLALVMATLLVFLYIVRRGKLDRIEWIRIGWRFCTAIICLLVMCLAWFEEYMLHYVSTYVVLILLLYSSNVIIVLGLYRLRLLS